MSYLLDAWCRDRRPLLFGEYLDPASMCYDAGADQLVIPMNANNAMAFIPLK